MWRTAIVGVQVLDHCGQHRSFRSWSGGQVLGSINHSVNDSFTSFGRAVAEMRSSGNDGGGMGGGGGGGW